MSDRSKTIDQIIEDALPREHRGFGSGSAVMVALRAAGRLAALTTPQEARSAAKVVPVSYEASASCSHGVCPTGCSHLMWQCSACSCEGGWGASREHLEEIAAQHKCPPSPQEGDAREVPHIPYPGESFDSRHAHDWADNACQSPNCMARPNGTTQPISPAAAPEVEWEYGATHIHPEKPASIRATVAEARSSQAFYDREIARHGHGDRSHLLRRTKAVPAGPWLPVGGENDDAML